MRVAIFVDAGYLYAQGSVALTGSAQRRTALELDIPSAVSKLRNTAEVQTNSVPLLRIYWYDGLPSGGHSYEQQKLADTNDVKLRLGVINPYGQQKGVDSLIVTDLVELARNNAITDAVLLSGDEDVRVGVQIAQSFGVRVHLIGIEPSRGSQSRSLLQESDTTTEWSKSDVSEFLSITSNIQLEGSTTGGMGAPEILGDIEAVLEQVVDELLATVDNMLPSDIDELNQGKIPHSYDSLLLTRSRANMGRDLNFHEKNRLRAKFKEKSAEAGYIK